MLTYTCAHCGAPASRYRVTLVLPSPRGERLWTIPVLVCTDEKCMAARGATFVEHRTKAAAAS